MRVVDSLNRYRKYYVLFNMRRRLYVWYTIGGEYGYIKWRDQAQVLASYQYALKFRRRMSKNTGIPIDELLLIEVPHSAYVDYLEQLKEFDTGVKKILDKKVIQD